MHKLSENELRFLKETGFTPTVCQCDEYGRTNKEPYYIDSFAEAQNIAEEDFNVDLIKLLDNINDIKDWDSLVLPDIAIYLFTTFFTKEELESKTDDELEKFLHDFRYHCGFRKFGWFGLCREIALKVFNDGWVVDEDEDGICIKDNTGRYQSMLDKYGKGWE